MLTAEMLVLQEVNAVPYMIRCLLLEILKLEQQNQILPTNVSLTANHYTTQFTLVTLTEKRLKIELCAIHESLEKRKLILLHG